MSGFRFGLGTALVLGLAIGMGTGSSGCSKRSETPVLAPDSTFVYAGKSAGDVSATITLADKAKVSKKTGKRLGVTRTFDIGTDEKVHAFVDLENAGARGGRPLLLHMVWINPDRETIFQKRLEYAPGDTTTALSSALSITKGKRAPGEYSFRVYLFRELIAEKFFTLRGESIDGEKSGDREM